MSGSTEPTGVPPIALPWRLRALNGLDPLIGRWLTPEASARHYMDAARTATGLDDFGPYDVETAAERLLSMLREEIDLHLFGKIAVSRLLQRNLENCLKVQHAFVEDPSLAEVDVERPIIIVCTPRTGSTLLHNLLAQHPNARAPQMWELHRPCPPPKPELARHDPRIAMSDREFGLYYRLIPEMRAIHYFAPQAVEECTHLFLNTLTCRMSFSVTAGLNSYVRWATELDMVPAYREYKRMLQILTRHYPNRTLILKSPAHLLCMDALATVFPSARVVHI
ncbi:MAG: sulfotransferase, partial [Polyangiales bacterium]